MTPYLLTVRESNGFVISSLEVGGVGGNANRFGISFGSSKKFFAWDNTAGYINVEDAETTQSRITDEPVFSTSIQAMSMSPTGQKGLYCHQNGIDIHAYKTVDSGENWEEANSEYNFIVMVSFSIAPNVFGLGEGRALMHYRFKHPQKLIRKLMLIICTSPLLLQIPCYRQ